jgi:SAM-dependent methyltransferase
VRSPAASPPATSRTNFRVGFTDTNIVGDAPRVHQPVQPGVADLPKLIVGHPVGHDADPPSSLAQPPQRIEILWTARRQLRHPAPVLRPQLLGRRDQLKRLADGYEEAVHRPGVMSIGHEQESQGRLIEPLGDDELLGPRLKRRAAIHECVVQVEQRQRLHTRTIASRAPTLRHRVIALRGVTDPPTVGAWLIRSSRSGAWPRSTTRWTRIAATWTRTEPWLTSSARSVLDIGCGTGTFACLLANRGLAVTAVDPAAASLAVARTKPGADRVRWIHGYAPDLPALQVDLATMTANVAQVFLTDEDWAATLHAAHAALRPGGHLAFETRDPAAKAWLDWNRDQSHRHTVIPPVGDVETWVDVIDIALCQLMRPVGWFCH